MWVALTLFHRAFWEVTSPKLPEMSNGQLSTDNHTLLCIRTNPLNELLHSDLEMYGVAKHMCTETGMLSGPCTLMFWSHSQICHYMHGGRRSLHSENRSWPWNREDSEHTGNMRDQDDHNKGATLKTHVNTSLENPSSIATHSTVIASQGC